MIERIKGFETDPLLIKAICKTQGLPAEFVAKALRYNILRTNQVATLTGLTLNQVNNKARPGLKKEPELTQVGAFVEWDEENKCEKDGALFILRNEATERLLRECNGMVV